MKGDDGAVASRRSEADQPPGGTSIDERGLFLLAQIDESGVTDRSAKQTIYPPRPDSIRKPYGSGEIRPQAMCLRELIVVFCDGHGRLLSECGFDWGGIAFHDHEDTRVPGGIHGQIVISRPDDRHLLLPFPKGAAYVLFIRADAGLEQGISGTHGQGAGPGAAERAMTYHPLRLYRIDVSTGGAVPDMSTLPYPVPTEPPAPLPMHKEDRPDAQQPHIELRRSATPALHAERPLLYNDDPSKCFDIVILGDGFSKEEQDMLRARAKVLKDGLLGMEPFSLYRDKINMHLVTAVSLDSGIDNCPYLEPRVAKRTHFDVTGDWMNVGWAGFFGTPSMDKVDAAVALVAPVSQVELIIMIVNTAMYGGSGFPGTRMAFVPTHYNSDTFVNLAAHESGHAIVGLADEYIGCIPPHKYWPTFPNLGTEAQRAQNRLGWMDLAEAHEKNPNTGSLLAQHTEGMPIHDYTREPILTPEAYEKFLGAFWGCMYIDPGTESDDLPCDPWADKRGRNFYRPMRRCKMRRLVWDFCLVCKKRIEWAILRAAT